MHAHHAVVNLAATAQPLPRGPRCVWAALGDTRFVDGSDGLDMRMVLRHDLLTAITQQLLIPLDRFEKTL